ncbi:MULTISPECIES: Lrp/AsnC family transcriptional regulator [Arthrobacter]|uniref:Lrp/AsnC family transcriptional regulator n=2 Tax=Arthrobacter TaxID=1663 RepID=A0ABU9KI21_9MICC|nr:Lrp/AsnC family transcriptional regulator [Arthrobacter sp. YJM1]MDP5226444.1 Lrp/AsnC family transcriptional regulator [Arthrobacter sp. YJM1]
MTNGTARSLDALDARIILALDKDPEASALALSRTLGVARNTVHARLRRLEEGGALKSFSRRLDPAALGFGLMAFVSLAISQTRAGSVEGGLAAIPEVIEVHATTGDHDLMARVVARDTADLYRVTNQLLEIDGIVRTSTAISVLEIIPARFDGLLNRLKDQEQPAGRTGV